MEGRSPPQRRRSIRLKGYDYSQPGAYFVTICVRDGECLFGQVVGGEVQLSDAGRMVQEVWNALPKQYQGVEIDAFVVMPNHVHGIIVLTGDTVGPTPKELAARGCPDGTMAADESVGATGQARGPAPTCKPEMDGGVGATPRGCPMGRPFANDSEGQAREPVLADKPEIDECVVATPRGRPMGRSFANDAEGQARGPAPTGGMSLPDVVHRFKSFTTARYRRGVRDQNWLPFPGALWQRNYWEHVIRDERGLRQIREYIVNNAARWTEDRMHPDAPTNPFARGSSRR